VNLDLPWNPAVLEQRIGRVHRLGQHRPVRVVNFIAQGTIEEAMLGVLSFKKSMFAGVLDGGESEVFLGGSKLKKFMESVEQTTGSIPASMPREENQAEEISTNGHGTKSNGRKTSPLDFEQLSSEEKDAEPQNAWTDVFSAGLSLLEKLQNAVSQDKPSGAAKTISLPANMIAKEESTGQSYLKLPLPDPQVLQKIFDFVKTLRGN
jgi:superfamily II DNA/RNA helicase